MAANGISPPADFHFRRGKKISTR